MDGLMEQIYSYFDSDFDIDHFKKYPDGSVYATAACDNGSTIEADLKCIVDDGVPLIEAHVRVDDGKGSYSGNKYIELSKDGQISRKDAEMCMRLFFEENMSCGG
jgi:hypothetical protein